MIIDLCSYKYKKFSDRRRNLYHLVSVPKYRCKVLRKPVVNMLMKDVLNNLAKNKNMFFYTMEVVYDHIYMFIEIPKNISVDYVIKYLKSQTARFIFLAFPGFRKRYPIEHL